MSRKIVIVGGGPAASACASYLCRARHRVVILADRKRPDLIIGESLVPAVVPFLRELGIEEEVASYSTYKPGATFSMRPGDLTTFLFQHGLPQFPTYAYNVPRDRFDETLLNAAIRSGAAVITRRAIFERLQDNRVTIDGESLSQAVSVLSGPPDLFIDATGRSRCLAKLFGIKAWEGPRKDTALFAHVDHTLITHAGHIHIDRLARGWAWRIPLPGKISVGIVAPRDSFRDYGESIEEQYDSLLAAEPIFSRYTASSRRLTPVMKYNNYQLTSDHFRGANWALLGDAAGFIDPIFSSGLLLALSGARDLSDVLSSGKSFRWYESRLRKRFLAWRRVVDYFYNGELFALIRLAKSREDALSTRLLAPHMNRHMARILTGVAADSAYTQGVLRFLVSTTLGEKSAFRMRVR